LEFVSVFFWNGEDSPAALVGERGAVANRVLLLIEKI